MSNRRPVVIVSRKPLGFACCQRCMEVEAKPMEGMVFGLTFKSDRHCVSCFSWILNTEGLIYGSYPDALTLVDELSKEEAIAQFTRVLEARRQTQRFGRRSTTWR